MATQTVTEPQHSAAGSVEQDLGWALGTVLRAYLKAAGETVAELPGGPRGYQVLSMAGSGSCHNQAAIAERLGIDRTVMTYLLDDLEERKLVVRKPDPADRRARQVTLTRKGEKTLAALSERIGLVERHVLGELSDAESEQLHALLGRAALALDAGGQPTDACQLAEAIDCSA